MNTADLYIRVSTDEQADKGYSQRNQEEVLRRYCEVNHIIVRQVIFEDHSAKTFVRPEWTKLLAYLRLHKNKSNLVLFTKWDRFSRNAPDAYQMIATLKALGVEPQAIEQPLDMSVPENKMMLAIYLTAPEIENDRRALNVFYGMRRARKEGRWVCTAPIGYMNKTLEGGRKTIVFREPQASLLRWVFNELGRGIFPTEQVWRMAMAKGLKCSKNNFWTAIRNPVYCGKIVIAKLKDEESYTVEGSHEPLISEGLFRQVQDVLYGRKRKAVMRPVAADEISLRGFVHCSNCSRILTGSKSKGRHAYYFYYHCSSECGYRQKAEVVNSSFYDLLDDLSVNPMAAPLFKKVIMNEFMNQSEHGRETKKDMIEQVTVLNTRVSKARELLLNGDIDSKDYKEIKAEAEAKIADLEWKVMELKSNHVPVSEVEQAIDGALETLGNLRVIYCKADRPTQKRIIGSMFAEKFKFEDLKDRTAQLSDVFTVIYLINRELEGKKNGTNDEFSCLSHRVSPMGFEPYIN